MESNNRLNLSAPWYTYQKKLTALFEYDPDVTVGPVLDVGDGKEMEIRVKGTDKSFALAQLLPETVTFGNVTLGLTVVHDNSEKTKADLWKAAFSDNPLFWTVQTIKDNAGMEHVYAIFEPKVIQFFNDDLSDYRGNFTALAADVARDVLNVFEDARVCVCTVDIGEEDLDG